MSNTSGKKLIHKGDLQKFIKSSELNQFLKNNPDWKLGASDKSKKDRSNFTKGRKHSESTKRKISESHKHVNKDLQRSILSECRKIKTKRWKDNHSKNAKGRIGVTDGINNKYFKTENEVIKFLELNPEWHRGIDDKRKAILQMNNTSGLARSRWIINNKDDIPRSRLEMTVVRKLRNLGYTVKINYQINEFYHPYDAYVVEKHCLVEIDGDYWHSKRNPKYKPERDKLRGVKALEEGYNFYLLKESEYEGCKIEKLVAFLNNIDIIK